MVAPLVSSNVVDRVHFSLKSCLATLLLVLACVMSVLRVSWMPVKSMPAHVISLQQTMTLPGAAYFARPLGALLNLATPWSHLHSPGTAGDSGDRLVTELASESGKNSSTDFDDHEQNDLELESDYGDQVFALLPVYQPQITEPVARTHFHFPAQYGASLVLPVEIPPPKA